MPESELKKTLPEAPNSTDDNAESSPEQASPTGIPTSPLPQSPMLSAGKMRKPPKRPAMVLVPGYQWNPLRGLPRNQLCPCRSGRKFKVCCLKALPQAVKKEEAKQLREQMKMPDLVFVLDKPRKPLEFKGEL